MVQTKVSIKFFEYEKKAQQDEWAFVFNEEQNISTDQSTSGMFINEKDMFKY
jgi:hypothetical protein